MPVLSRHITLRLITPRRPTHLERKTGFKTLKIHFHAELYVTYLTNEDHHALFKTSCSFEHHTKQFSRPH